MAIRSLSTSSISTGAKRSKFWDQSATTVTDYDSIATQIVGSGGASYVEFTSIPQTYKHLELSYVGRQTGSGNVYGRMSVNGDTTNTNYTGHDFFAYSAGAAASHYGNQSGLAIQKFSGSDSPTGTFGSGVVTILDYTSTSKNKVSLCWGGVVQNNTSQPEVDLVSGLWLNTNAVTSLRISPSGNNWAEGTQFALYGIKG